MLPRLAGSLLLCLSLHAREAEPQETWDAEPKLVERVDPEYPPDAEREGIKGEVMLQVRVEVDGSTTHLKTVRPLPLCTEAAVAAAEKWRWEPAKKDGEPIAATGIVTVRFPPGSQERR